MERPVRSIRIMCRLSRSDYIINTMNSPHLGAQLRIEDMFHFSMYPSLPEGKRWRKMAADLLETAMTDEAIKRIFLLTPDERDVGSLTKEWGIKGRGVFVVRHDDWIGRIPMVVSGARIIGNALNHVHCIEHNVSQKNILPAPGSRIN